MMAEPMKTHTQSTSFLKLLAAVALIGAAGSSAYANPSVTLDVSAYGDLSGYGGGEFTAIGSGLSTAGYASSTSAGGTFETFCMAYNEEFVPGNWGGPAYNYYLSNNTFANPTNVVSSTLTEGTAWLYSQFSTGTLGGYDYSTGFTSNRATTALELQEAIWSLQNSPGAPLVTVGSDPFLAEVVSAFGGSLATAKSNATPGYDGVQIMVLTNSDPGAGGTPNAQPQLYYSVPDNGTTVLLLGVALVALMTFGRRAIKRA
jgi:hypothetical protein